MLFRSHFKRIQFGLEDVYQICLQTILLFLATTATSTTGGLNKMFEKSGMLGIEMDAEIVLILSISLSLKSVIWLLVKTINAEKVYLPMKAKLLCLLPWSACACCRRILSMVTFFLPSLGLFSILYHWKAEQVPFNLRKFYASLGRLSSNDTLELFGATENISWSVIDRGQYDDKYKYNPVTYSTYTGLSLGATFSAFIILSSVNYTP